MKYVSRNIRPTIGQIVLKLVCRYILRSSKIETDLNEDIIRGKGLEIGYGGGNPKVCTIDSNWPGLKFVFYTDRPLILLFAGKEFKSEIAYNCWN